MVDSTNVWFKKNKKVFFSPNMWFEDQISLSEFESSTHCWAKQIGYHPKNPPCPLNYWGPHVHQLSRSVLIMNKSIQWVFPASYADFFLQRWTEQKSWRAAEYQRHDQIKCQKHCQKTKCRNISFISLCLSFYF